MNVAFAASLSLCALTLALLVPGVSVSVTIFILKSFFSFLFFYIGESLRSRFSP